MPQTTDKPDKILETTLFRYQATDSTGWSLHLSEEKQMK